MTGLVPLMTYYNQLHVQMLKAPPAPLHGAQRLNDPLVTWQAGPGMARASYGLEGGEDTQTEYRENG